MNNKSQRFWDRVSKLSRPKDNGLSQTSNKTVDSIQKYISKESVILDFGCGPGDLTIAMSQSAKSIYAIDISPGMLEVARTRADEQDIENVDFVQAEILANHLIEKKFSIITAFNILHFINDIKMLSRKINNLLTPGGLFVSSTGCLGERWSFLAILTLILTKLKIMPDTNFYTKAELENQITSAGFQIVETKELTQLPQYFIVAKKAK